MGDVKRYNLRYGAMHESMRGHYVKHADYAARLEAVEKERDEALGWRTVAESNQAMAQSWQARAEAAEAALAKLEPRDGERWVTPDMILYQYEWMGWLSGDQPLVPIECLRAAEAALATARRDALEEAARVAETAKAVCARCNSPEDNHPYRHPFVPVVMVNIPAAIRALKDTLPEPPRDI